MGISTQVVTYHAAGPAYAWCAAVDRTLVQRGWVYPAWSVPADWQAPSYIYWLEFGLGALWSQAYLSGSANDARITIRRWVELPWWDVRWPTFSNNDDGHPAV